MQTFEDFLIEGDFKGLALKSQKTIDLCRLVVEKFDKNPEEVRAIMQETPFSYAQMKTLTDKLSKL